jgi:NAD(P)-dependent dehydrogenase (short-subunit alcohol dehydrogenase family)
MQRAVAATIERFGHLDIVVANAGIVAPASTFLATPYEHFERVIDVNLNGVCRSVDAALPQIVKHKGHVVVTSSIAAFRNGYGRASYAVSKAAVEQFGHALRLELVPHGAGASVVYFGLIDTPMVASSDDETLSAVKNRTIPKRLRSLTSAAVAGAAVASGIERRQARIFCPPGWARRSAVRGIQVPIGDLRKARDRLVHETVRQLDGAASVPDD